MDIVESELSSGDIKGVFRKASAKSKKKSETRFGKLMGRQKVTYDDLMDMWKSEHYTNDSKDIIGMLKNAGFSRLAISGAFRKSKVSKKKGSNPKIERLANVIKKYNLQAPIKQYLETRFKIKESVIYEKTLSDKDIKKVFVKMVSVKDEPGKVDTQYIEGILNKLRSDPSKIEPGFTVETPDGTYTWKGAQWVNKGRLARREMRPELDRLAIEKNNKQVKEPLLKELVDYIADRYGHPEWEALSTKAQAIIKQAKLPSDIAGTAMGSLRRGQYYGDVTESRLINVNDLQLTEMFAKLVQQTTYGRGKKDATRNITF